MIHTSKERKRDILILGLVMLFQLIIYLPNVGTGFIKDDLIWLENVVTEGRVDYLKPFTISTGFYRPLVSLTFGMQYEFFGMNSVPYGLLNLFIHLFNLILVYLILSSFKVFKPYALLGVLFFSMNVKSISMAVGWISGRTTLLFTFFTLLSLYLYQKGRKIHFQKDGNIKKKYLIFFSWIFLLCCFIIKRECCCCTNFYILLFLFCVE